MERLVRVNALLKRELGLLFERHLTDFRDCLVTVTEVSVAPNLRHAGVLLSVYGGGPDRPAAVLAALRRLRAEIQHDVATRVKIKYTPVLHFELDERPAKADRLMHLLDQLDKDSPAS